MTKQPRFSIIIPAFNEERLIGKCLDSLKKLHTSETYEIIVVDNNSTDKTAAIASSKGARVIHETNAGVCWARQAGLEAARGKIIISTDADSFFEHDWLDKIDAHFKSSEGVIAVGGSVSYTNAPAWCGPYARALFGLSRLWSNIFGNPMYISACNLAFYRSAFSKYNTNLTMGGDELGVLKVLRKKGRVIMDPSITVATSGRRQTRGLLYSVFVTGFVYYLLNYWLGSLFNKSPFGDYPAFRENINKRTQLLRSEVNTLAIILIVIVALLFHERGFIDSKLHHGIRAPKLVLHHLSKI